MRCTNLRIVVLRSFEIVIVAVNPMLFEVLQLLFVGGTITRDEIEACDGGLDLSRCLCDEFCFFVIQSFAGGYQAVA